ncbi:GNAT family N-acetyltransferase [Streptomyces sp. NPDC048269]|uniref:GNAT family N-acetyltransferase n=1 Tax=Streptomyces sp. NPDC048269 TaxID=3155753 RepID=UPI003412565E
METVETVETVETHLHDSAAHLTTAQWEDLYGSGYADRGHGYALFRERVEAGPSALVTAADGTGWCGALHGAVTTPASALFSHPWKLLTAEQLRRPEEDGGQQACETHAALLRTALGESAGPDGLAVPDAAALTAVLGEAVVFRGFDSTEAGLRDGLDAPARRRTLRALLAHTQDAVRDGLAGAVCLPYVRPQDTDLRAVLAELGFRSAVLTGVSDFDLGGVSSYATYLEALPSRRRRMYRKEEQAVADSALSLGVWPLDGNVERVVALEARNIAKHGGLPDREALIAARSAMAGLLGDHLRVPVAVRTGAGAGDDELAACGIHMADDDSYCVLMYGADESVSDAGPVYPCLTFYEPLRHAADHGLRTVRLGFEAFSAKLRRGARLSRRETWLWTPDADRLAALHRVMEFLSARTSTHFERLTGQTA